MPLPIENVIAAFPPSVKAGNVTLHALSIGGAIRLAEIGVDAKKTPVPKDKLFAAAFVLGEVQRFGMFGRFGASLFGRFNTSQTSQTSPTFQTFIKRARCGLKELENAVEDVLNQAFSTFIPPMQQKDAPAQLTPDGLGWPLELAGFLCAEYGWTFEYALATPVCRAFALQAVSRVLHGGKHGGPDYVERTLDIVRNANH